MPHRVMPSSRPTTIEFLGVDGPSSALDRPAEAAMRRVKARLLLLFSAPGRITNWPELCPIHRKGNPRITSAASARNEWLAQIYPLCPFSAGCFIKVLSRGALSQGALSGCFIRVFYLKVLSQGAFSGCFFLRVFYL